MTDNSTTTPPVPSPRPAEEIRSPADIDHLVEQLSVQNFRPIRGELYAALSELRDHRAEVERLSAELADAQAENERLTGASECNHLAKVEWFHRAVAAERALEAVRAQADEWRGTHWANDVHERSVGFADDIRAALSAASPTTGDDEQPLSDEPDVPPTAGLRRSSLAPVAIRVASDEPARCPHGHTEAHDVIVSGFPVPPWFRCPGPAASGTPETTA